MKKNLQKNPVLLLGWHIILFIFGIKILLLLFPQGFMYHCWAHLLVGIPFGNFVEILFQLIFDFLNFWIMLSVLLITYGLIVDIQNIIKRGR